MARVIYDFLHYNIYADQGVALASYGIFPVLPNKFSPIMNFLRNFTDLGKSPRGKKIES